MSRIYFELEYCLKETNRVQSIFIWQNNISMHPIKCKYMMWKSNVTRIQYLTQMSFIQTILFPFLFFTLLFHCNFSSSTTYETIYVFWSITQPTCARGLYANPIVEELVEVLPCPYHDISSARHCFNPSPSPIPTGRSSVV